MSYNTKVKLKVCGMRYPDNVLEIAKLSPDYMGFIFFKGSKRYVGDDFSMPEKFPGNIVRVGVFVNDSTPEIIRLARKHDLEFIQLHGNESLSQCVEIKDKGFKVIKVFSVDNNFNFKSLDEFKSVVDFFLFDTKGDDYGGNGIAFDWNILKKYDQEVPFFLSGGISVDNIENLFQLNGMNIHAIDINSKVESSVAIKDPDLIYKLNSKLRQTI